MLTTTVVAGVVAGADVAGLNDVHPAHIMIPTRRILTIIHFIVKFQCYMGLVKYIGVIFREYLNKEFYRQLKGLRRVRQNKRFLSYCNIGKLPDNIPQPEGLVYPPLTIGGISRIEIDLHFPAL
jgi:hypothetical protein